MIRVDYLVRVISLLLLIGILTSCVPEEDAVESSSSGGGAILGDVQILWGKNAVHTVTFNTAFTEIPSVTVSGESGFLILGQDNVSTTGFQVSPTNVKFSWQAIGKYK